MQQDVLNEFENRYVYASVGQRFVNYLIDVIVFYFLTFLFSAVLGAVLFASGGISDDSGPSMLLIYLLVLGVFIGYYTLMEGTRGKTVGKMLTKTKVLKTDGTPIGYKDAFLRSLSRIVPIEWLSIFFGNGQMWHDSWTNTMLVKENN